MIPLPLDERLKKLFRDIGEHAIVANLDVQPWSSRSHDRARLETFCKYLKVDDLYAASWVQRSAARAADREDRPTVVRPSEIGDVGIEYLTSAWMRIARPIATRWRSSSAACLRC